ncbi:hypothetical protein N431DRAFT_458571 [Stipitochalara longipes BDJ]|nr:hypothetical protein N431DRAFT_458571 [Stipitochalara longipes BDJ]
MAADSASSTRANLDMPHGPKDKQTIKAGVTTAAATSTPKTPTLIALPAELHLEVFKHLEVCTSVCIGLTCKKMWEIHYNIHGKVSLGWLAFIHEPLEVDMPDGRTFDVGHLIEDWMGPRYFWHFVSHTFRPITEKPAFDHLFKCHRHFEGPGACDICDSYI